MFEPKTSNKQRNIRILIVVVVFFVAFGIGIVIGFFGIKKPESKEQDAAQQPKKEDKKAELQKRQEEMMKYHKTFQTTVAAEELEKDLK